MHRALPRLKASLLVLLPLICYLPAMRGDYVFDDVSLVRDNALLKADDGLARIWFSTEPVDYWPVSYTALWIEWRLWGSDTLGYHLVNLALHLACAALIWRLLHRLNMPGAWLAAMLFAVHPVNVESVAWIFQQKTLLAAVAWFGSILCYLSYLDEQRRRWHIAALVLFAFGMLAKTSVAPLPMVLLAVVWIKRRTLNRHDLAALAPFFATALLLGAVAVWFQHYRAIGGGVVRDCGLGERTLDAARITWFYLGKACLPDVCFVYPTWSSDPSRLLSYLPLLGLTAIAIACWQLRHRYPQGCVALGYYLLALVPVAGFVDISYMQYTLVADHWQYLALLAPIALFAAGLATVMGDRPSRRVLAGAVVASLAVIVCSGISWQEAHKYRDNFTLWTATAAKNPDAWLAHNNLGVDCAGRDQHIAAEAHFRRALSLSPGHRAIVGNLGMALVRQRRHDEALALTRSALAQYPHEGLLHLATGAALAGQDRHAEAVPYLQQACQLRPGDALSHSTLGQTLLHLGDAPAAADHYAQAAAIKSDVASFQVGLAQAYALQGKTRQCGEALRRALELEPDNLDAQLQHANWLEATGKMNEALVYLADATARQPDAAQLHAAHGEKRAQFGQLTEALACLDRAIECDAKIAETHALRGDVLLRAQRPAEAQAAYQRALELKPHLTAARRCYAEVLTQQGDARQAIEQYRQVLHASPTDAGAATQLAWLLATREDASDKDLREAVAWAQQACRQTAHQHPVALDTLAQAYEASGDFARAARAAEQALQRAASMGQTAFAADVDRRLERYRARQARAADSAGGPLLR